MTARIWLPEAPFLSLRRYNEIAISSPSVSLEGWFEVEMVHARTGLVAFHSRFRNMITDNGLNTLATTAPASSTFYVGVGSNGTAPAAGQSALFAELAGGRANTDGGFGSQITMAPDNASWCGVKFTKVFSTTQGNGNIAEIGMFSQPSGGIMFCRQLIKDGAGNATVLTKTNEYELRVVYEVRYYPSPGDTPYTATVNGVNQTVTARPRYLANNTTDWTPYYKACPGTTPSDWYFATGALAPISANPLGSTAQASTVTAQTYTAFSNFLEYVVEWNGSAANTSTYLTLHGGRYGCPHQHQLSAGVTKTNTQKYVGLFRSSWGRL